MSRHHAYKRLIIFRY